MLFNKPHIEEELDTDGETTVNTNEDNSVQDDVETVVGPSVTVEGDLSSKGNIIVKGTVSGSVSTSKQLTVEKGAKIVADVKANNALVSGEIRGNIKISESLELTSTSKILGDITVKTLSVEPGSVLCGKITMPGIDPADKNNRLSKKKKSPDEFAV